MKPNGEKVQKKLQEKFDAIYPPSSSGKKCFEISHYYIWQQGSRKDAIGEKIFIKETTDINSLVGKIGLFFTSENIDTIKYLMKGYKSSSIAFNVDTKANTCEAVFCFTKTYRQIQEVEF